MIINIDGFEVILYSHHLQDQLWVLAIFYVALFLIFYFPYFTVVHIYLRRLHLQFPQWEQFCSFLLWGPCYVLVSVILESCLVQHQMKQQI